MNNFELITKYLPKAVDKYFFEDSKTAILERGNKYIDVNFSESGYVKIASIVMDGLSDYYQTQTNSEGFDNPSNARPTDPEYYAAYAGNIASGSRDGFAIGNVDVKWEIFRLQWVRGRQFRIDYISNEETAGVIIGNAIEEFHRTKVIPEVDAVRFSKIAERASVSLGNLVTEDIGANTIIGKFNTAIEWLAEHEVPQEEQILFVSNAVMTLIMNSTEITKFITQGDFRSEAGLSFRVQKYNGVPIIAVPSNRFFTNVYVSESNGYRATTASKLINFMVVSAKACTPIRKLEWTKMYGPEQSGLVGYHGYLINYLLYHGIVIPENKLTGVYVSVASTGNATAKVNVLAVDTKAGAVQYAWKLNAYFTNPAGLRGYVVYNYTSAFTLGGDISSVGTLGTDYFIATKGADQTSTSSQTTAYFALVDDYGKIIATSGSTAVTLERHA